MSMKITTQTEDVLTIKAGAKTRLLMLGLLVALLGLVVVGIGWMRLMHGFDIESPKLMRVQQVQLDDPSKDLPTSGETTVLFTYYTGNILFARQRLFYAIGIVAFVFAMAIFIEPHWNRRITFDKSKQQVIIKRPGWFFCTHTETHPLKNVVEVEIEKKPDSDPKRANYRVILTITRDKGVPLSPNYVHYKEVVPLCLSYQETEQDAHVVADNIREFITQ